jgi:hypothetical protein
MGLQSNQSHVLGRDQKFFVIKETTPGTFVKATTAASANCLTTSFVPGVGRKDRLDANLATRSITERITDKEEHSWSYEGFWVPSGTKNTAPDIGDMVLAAMGTETVNANDVTYSLASSQQLTTLSMTRHLNSIFQESLSGAWVEEMKLTAAGGEEPKISFSGGAMSYAATGYSTLNGAMAASATTMIVQTADKNAFMTNPSAVGGAGAGARSVVVIDDGNDTDNDVEVTADAAPSFTVTAIGAAEQASGATVNPYVPTHTDAGSPINGVSGSLTYDSFSARITGFELTLKNNIKANSDAAIEARVTDVIPGMREVGGSLTFRCRQDHLVHILNRRELTTRALTLNLGGAAQSGTRLVVSIPTLELEWSEVSIPQSEEATISLPFRALGSSGNDEFTLQHT